MMFDWFLDLFIWAEATDVFDEEPIKEESRAKPEEVIWSGS